MGSKQIFGIPMATETRDTETEAAEFLMIERLTQLKNHQDEIEEDMENLEKKLNECTKKADIGMIAMHVQQQEWQIFQVFALMMTCVAGVLTFDYMTSGIRSPVVAKCLFILNNTVLSGALVICLSAIISMLVELGTLKTKLNREVKLVEGGDISDQEESLSLFPIPTNITPEMMVAGGDGFHIENPESDDAAGSDDTDGEETASDVEVET